MSTCRPSAFVTTHFSCRQSRIQSTTTLLREPKQWAPVFRISLSSLLYRSVQSIHPSPFNRKISSCKGIRRKESQAPSNCFLPRGAQGQGKPTSFDRPRFRLFGRLTPPRRVYSINCVIVYDWKLLSSYSHPVEILLLHTKRRVTTHFSSPSESAQTLFTSRGVSIIRFFIYTS